MMVIVPLTAVESFLPGRRYDLRIPFASSASNPGVLKSAACSHSLPFKAGMRLVDRDALVVLTSHVFIECIDARAEQAATSASDLLHSPIGVLKSTG